MKFLKRIVKRHTHNLFFKSLAGLGRAFNKLYENRNHDIFSNGEANLLKKLGTLNPQIIFDVGANVGEYAQLVSAHCPSAKIYSFEPVQSTFELLCTEVGKNKKIHPYKNGFYKEGKEMQINLYDSNAHSSIYDISGADQQATDMETIHLISGDVFMLENAIERIDFLKLDVEGLRWMLCKDWRKRLRTIKSE